MLHEDGLEKRKRGDRINGEQERGDLRNGRRDINQKRIKEGRDGRRLRDRADFTQ